MKELEKSFLNSDFIRADDKYIGNSYCLISKDYIYSKALKDVKNTDNIFNECKDKVPFGKGEDYDCTSIGTKCILNPHYEICILYNNKYGFSYRYIKMLIEQVPYWEVSCFYVIENKQKEPILKMFVGDKFVGCLMCMKRADVRD